MAGFRQRPGTPVTEITMVAYPLITVFIDLSESGPGVWTAEGRSERGSFVAGLLPGGLRTTCHQAECLQIRLDPAAAPELAEVSGTSATLAQVWGRDADRIEERLRANPSWEERFTIVAGLLGRRLSAHRPVDPEVAQVWRRIRAGHGQLRVETLAAEVGWSRKRLWSRFRAQLGVNPKRVARLVRFDRAAHLLAAGHTSAGAAAFGGYADQAHMHREVQEFAGLTPTALAAAPWLAVDPVAWPGQAVPR
ncbi:AraC-like DNA-binding protein [Actinoplanes tereljensis]|uniref:AraC family transcriptional regulator n=1 Tax=Paractinoplanes tereljensis TaxID=571912 RepID=A0A919NP67_9ACTN|nr:AraC family transcriptional regulator [Actinoplanes tereljensis]GIF22133.1 AraC family transcriptional regulator [Actinoplanes tereljensis]